MTKRKKSETLERHLRRLELEGMAGQLEDMLMTRMFEMLDEETTITFMNSNLVSAKTALRVMAASDDGSSLVSKGTTISRRMSISWSLIIYTESIEERRASTSKMADDWIKEVVYKMVFRRICPLRTV